jgi:hypothetical protein
MSRSARTSDLGSDFFGKSAPYRYPVAGTCRTDLNDEQIDTLLATLRKQVLEHAVELN